MRTGIVTAALLFCVSVALAGEKSVWVLPEGVNGGEVAGRLRDISAWPELDGAGHWKSALARQAFILGGTSGRVSLEIDVPPGASVLVLDQLVLHFYRQYRDERLPALPALIELERIEQQKARREAEELRGRMKEMLASGTGVVDRDGAIAASAERIEELRRRIVDARIEMAVLEARLRGFLAQAERREMDLKIRRQEQIAALKLALKQDVEDQLFMEASGIYKKREQEIEELRRSPQEDGRLEGLLDVLAESETDKIGMEELVKALTVAVEEERARSLRILGARDLGGFQAYVLQPAEDRVETRSHQRAALEKELAGLRSAVLPVRVTVEPGSDEVPRVYVLGKVGRPGEYLVSERPLTLLSLLAQAGDLVADADRKGVRILRREGGRTHVLAVDLTGILDGKVPDITLKPHDIVYVPEAR